MKAAAVCWLLVACGCAPTVAATTPCPVATAPSATVPSATAAPSAVAVNTPGKVAWPTWVGIVCDDFAAQRSFYGQLLGVPESNVREGSVQFLLDGKIVELFARSSVPQYAKRGVAVGFVVDDLIRARGELVARGIRTVSEIESDGRDRWAYFEDGDGNLFELVEGRR